MAEAKIDMSAADRNVLEFIKTVAKGFDKIVESQVRVEQATQRTAAAAERTYSEMAAGAGQTILNLAGVGSAIALIAKGWDLVKESHQAYMDQLERARQTSIALAGKQLQAISAFAPDKSMPNFGAVESRITQMSNRLNVPKGGLYMQAEAAFGAGGMLSNEQKLRAVETVASYAPNLPDEGKAWLQSFTMDLMSTYGVDDKTALGLVLRGNAGHKTTALGQYAQHVSGGIKALGNMGYSIEEAFALTTGLSQAAADYKGRESTTAAQRLGQQIFQETSQFPQMEGKTLDERLKWLHTDPMGKSVAMQMTGVLGTQARAAGWTGKPGISMEADSLMAAIQIIEGKGEGWNQYKTAREAGVDINTAAAFMASKAAEIAAMDLQRVARGDLEREAKTESLQTRPGRAAEGVAAKGFEDYLNEADATVVGPMDRASARARYWYLTQFGGVKPSEAGAGVLDALGEGVRKYYGGNANMTKEQADAARMLQEAAQQLLQSSQNMRAGVPTSNGDRPAAPFKDATATAGPAANVRGG